MVLVLNDLRPLLALLPAVVALAGGLWVFEYRTSHRPSRALDRDEWILLCQLVSIPILVLLIVTARIALRAPAGQFLYGRF